MLCHLLKRLWKYFLEINLYKKPSSNEHSLQTETFATRIYISLSIITIIIITTTVASFDRTVNRIEYSPTSDRFTRLAAHYPSNLHCPCSKVGIAYDTFVSTHVTFHQVCSSQFIEQSWIDMMFAAQNMRMTSSDDFHSWLLFFWHLIAGLCNISDRAWSEAVASFGATHILSRVALSADFLRTQVFEDLQKQLTLSRSTVSEELQSIRRTIRGNQMVSALATNFYLRYPHTDWGEDWWITPKMASRIYDGCSCLKMIGCPHPAMVNDSHGQLVVVPGMVMDCFILDGTLASTLECYYNQTCLSILHESLPMTIIPLSYNSNKSFMINSTIEMLLNEIMMDDLTSSVNYELYYTQCNPSYCAYSYTHRFDVLFIFTTLFAIFGGSSLILKLIAPLIATVILNRKNRITPSDQIPIYQNRLFILFQHLRLLPSCISQRIIHFNLFVSHTPRTNTNLFRERLLTRVFIILITICSTVSGFYIVLANQNQVVTNVHPTFDFYEKLYERYPNTLQCPCSQVSVSYGIFLNVTYLLHQVCSSQLISPTWLDYLARLDPIELPFILFNDFREIGFAYFQLLAIFCSHVENHIQEAQRIFTNTRFVNKDVPTPSSFTQQTDAIIETYINTTRNTFERSIDWIKVTLATNHILTGTNTNFYINIDLNNSVTIRDGFFDGGFVIDGDQIFAYGLCVCEVEISDCFGWNFLFPTENTQLRNENYFPDLPIGCVPLTGFLRSTFSWWYNETYLENIQSSYAVFLPTQSLPNITSLKISIPTRFQNETMEYLLREMFTETSINNKTDFKAFYNSCAPISCSYTIVQRRPILVLLLLFISICGGLNKVLQILVPCIGKCVFFSIDYWNHPFTRRLYSLTARFKYALPMIYHSIRQINLYKTRATDQPIIQLQRTYTKLYILLVISSLSILLFYNAIIERSITKTYMLPSVEDYEHLLTLYYGGVHCPCSYITISYDKFVTELRVKAFHQMCSTSALFTIMIAGTTSPQGVYLEQNDFRNLRMPLFNVLQQLCILAQETVENSIIKFRTSTMFIEQMMPREEFYKELNETLDRFQKKTPIEFARTLNIIRTSIHGNALLSQIPSGWQLLMNENNQGKNASFHSEPRVYFDEEHNTSCTCTTRRTCTMPAQVFNDASTDILVGFRLGCYALETALLSSYSCFYSRTCIDRYRNLTIPYYTDLDPFLYYGNESVPLNSSATRFRINDTVEIMAYELFIESWMNDVSYEKFFNSCAPNYCTYQYYYRFDVLELLSTFLSVYNGLTIVIRFITPFLISMMREIQRRFTFIRRHWMNFR